MTCRNMVDPQQIADALTTIAAALIVLKAGAAPAAPTPIAFQLYRPLSFAISSHLLPPMARNT